MIFFFSINVFVCVCVCVARDGAQDLLGASQVLYY